jgi:hypothetical protein
MSDAATQDPNSTTSPPLGIKIICAFGVFTVLIGFLGAFIFLASGVLTWEFLTLLVVGIEIIVTYGLWTLTSWGWVSAVVWYGLSIFLSLYQFIQGDISSFSGIIVSGLILTGLYVCRDFYI